MIEFLSQRRKKMEWHARFLVKVLQLHSVSFEAGSWQDFSNQARLLEKRNMQRSCTSCVCTCAYTRAMCTCLTWEQSARREGVIQPVCPFRWKMAIVCLNHENSCVGMMIAFLCVQESRKKSDPRRYVITPFRASCIYFASWQTSAVTLFENCL